MTLPSSAEPSGSSRVQSTKPPGLGSPEATPRLNGLSTLKGGAARDGDVRPISTAPAASDPPVRNNVRRLMRASQSPVRAILRGSSIGDLLPFGGSRDRPPPPRERATCERGGPASP